MKFIGMSAFILVGALIGYSVNRAFSGNTLGNAINIGIGILGAFSGLIIKDLSDIHIMGNFIDAVLFSSLSALVLTVFINLVIRK